MPSIHHNAYKNTARKHFSGLKTTDTIVIHQYTFYKKYQATWNVVIIKLIAQGLREIFLITS